MAKRDRYASYQVVQGPQKYQTFIYTLLRRSVIFRKYRIFHTLDKEHGTYSIRIPNPFFFSLTIPDYRGVFIAYDFGVTGGCKKSREVIIKAWKGDSEDREIESRTYKILSASPMKGVPSLIENRVDSDRWLYALVLEKLGPSLEDLYQLMPGKKRFDEKMILAIAIQMVRDFPVSLIPTHVPLIL